MNYNNLVPFAHSRRSLILLLRVCLRPSTHIPTTICTFTFCTRPSFFFIPPLILLDIRRGRKLALSPNLLSIYVENNRHRYANDGNTTEKLLRVSGYQHSNT